MTGAARSLTTSRRGRADFGGTRDDRPAGPLVIEWLWPQMTERAQYPDNGRSVWDDLVTIAYQDMTERQHVELVDGLIAEGAEQR
jgi:hypothetical protein